MWENCSIEGQGKRRERGREREKIKKFLAGVAQGVNTGYVNKWQGSLWSTREKERERERENGGMYVGVYSDPPNASCGRLNFLQTTWSPEVGN